MAKQKLSVELAANTKPFDKAMEDAAKGVNNFGKGLTKISGLIKGSLIGGGVLAAFEGIKKILDSSQMSGDKLAAAMKGVSGAATAAAQSLAQADFSVSLRAAYKAAKELEQVYDDLQDRQRSLNVLSSANTLEVARLQGILKNSAKTEQEIRDAAQKIKDIYAEEAKLRERSTFGAIQGEIDALKTKYNISQEQAQSVLDYATNYAKYTKEQQDNLNAAMEAEKKLDTYLNNNTETRDKIVKNLKEAASATKDKVIPEMQQWIDLWRPINDYSDKHRDQVAQLVIDYNNILSARQRELNMADRINDRMGVQIEAVKEIQHSYETLIGGNMSPIMPLISGEPESYNLSTKGQTETSKMLIDQIALANELSSVFSDIFSAADEGWKGMADIAIESIKRIVIELLSKAAAFAVLSAILPGSTAMPSFLNFITGGSIGMSGVPSMASAGGNHLTAEFRISGSDLVAVVGRSSTKQNRNT